MTKYYRIISTTGQNSWAICQLIVVYVLLAAISLAPLVLHAQNIRQNPLLDKIEKDSNHNFNFTDSNYSGFNKKNQVIHIYSFHNDLVNPDEIVTGIVIDSNTGEPLSNVTIWIEGTSIATQSSMNGSFKITIPENHESGTLSFRLVGFRQKNIPLQEITSRQESIRNQNLQNETIQIELTPDIIRFEDIIVTSSPTGSGISYQPDRAFSGEELHRKRDITIGHMLDGEPGVAMRSLGPAPARPVIRGLDGERILILENGERMGDLSESAADHSVALDPNATDRLEIVRGPASLLYGSSALGGVINLITSDIPQDWTTGLSGSTSFSGASMNKMGAFFGRFGYGAQNHALNARFSIRGAGNMSTPAGYVPYTGLSNMEGSVGYGFRFGETLGGFNIMGMQSAYGIPGNPADPSHVEIRFDRIATQGKLEGIIPGFFDKYQWKFHAAAFDQQEVELSRTLFSLPETESMSMESIPLEYRQRSVSTTLNLQHRPIGILDRGVLGLNVNGRILDVMGTDAYTPGDQYLNVALFTFQEIPINSIWWTQMGVRFDYRTLGTRENSANPDIDGRNTNFNVAGSVGLNIKPFESLEMGFQLAKAHRYPTVEELFSDGAHLGAGSYEIGDPSLKTEHGIGLDFFTRYEADWIKMEIATFYTVIRNFIRFQPGGEIHGPSGFPVFRYQSGDARLWGGEFSALVQMSEYWSVPLGSDFVHGKNIGTIRTQSFSDSEAQKTIPQHWNKIPMNGTQNNHEQPITQISKDTPLPMMPPLRFRLGTEVVLGSSWIGSTLRYVTTQNRVAPGEDPTNGYALVSFQAGHRIDASGLHRIVFRIDNALDTTYQDHLSRIEDRGNPMPGRNITLVYSYSF